MLPNRSATPPVSSRTRHTKTNLLMTLAMSTSGLISTDVVLAEEKRNIPTLNTIEVTDFRGEQVASPKYARDLQDTPRIITVLPDDLLQEQGQPRSRTP